MRVVPGMALGLVLACSGAAASPPAADAGSRWIVALAPGTDAGRVARMERGEPLAARLAAAGLRVSARLAEPGAAPLAAAPPAWAFDPARIVLVEGDSATAASPLAGDPAVAWCEPDLEREPCVWEVGTVRPAPGDGRRGATLTADIPDLFPNDPLCRNGRQWGLVSPAAGVNARAAWARSVGDDSVLLGVCDTGVDPAHPELGGALRDGSARLVGGLDVTSVAAPYADSVAHGTLVAGVMAARTHDGAHFDSLGIAGVCGGDGVTGAGCRIVPVRITRGSATAASSFAIAHGILHAASAGARAINLSFAATGVSRTERLALLDALARGALVVCAAGNGGLRPGGAAMYPASHSADGLCVQVGAGDPQGRRCAFSSHGPGLDVLAPGLDVWTTYMTYPSAAGWWPSPYVAASGTSFAAPFATGTIGLLAAARPDLAPEDFQHVLRLSARDAGEPGPDSLTGFGLLDAAAALERVGPGTALWHGEIAPVAGEVARDTLVVAERGLALLDSLGRRALVERWTLRARIALPDSFADSAHAWVRVSGVTTTRGDWRVPYVTPWADVRQVGPRVFEVEGALFRIVDARAGRLVGFDDPARWIPAPPERARVAFTVMGGRRVPPAGPRPGAAGAGPIRVTPNPVRGAATFAGPPGARVRVMDVTGREVARLTLGADGRTRWNGIGHGGRVLPPGLYWAVAPGERATRFARVR